MFRIQTLNTIAPIGLSQFPQDLYEVGTGLSSPDAILVRSQDMHEMILPESVQVIGRAGAGVNNIPVSLLTQRGIPVLNTPGANANAVRELVIAGMLMASRNICQAWNYVNTLKTLGTDIEKSVEQHKKKFVGIELLGKTLGIVGLGSVGVKVANAALHLGMKVIGYDPTITVARAWELSSDVKQAQNLEELLQQSDFVTLHVPLIPETKNMIHASRFQRMKNNAVLLNFSREGIIDNAALIDAIASQKISTYVTDFPNVQLIHLPNVISLPHLGASTKEAEDNCAMMIVKQIRDFFEKGSISNSVNFPSLEMPLSPMSVRLSVINKNIPNMVAQISSKLANAKLNIISLMNKSREEVAYTLIDVNGNVSLELMQEIASIAGVMHVRKILVGGQT